MTRVFISYSHKDEALRAELDAHLALLKREGVLDVWTDHEIPAGGDVHPSISQGLEEADIVLLLISQYFNSSDYCASIEMKRALERHAAGECVAVPVLMRPCDWQTAPYARLNAVPRDNRPVTQWPSQDAAFAEIVKELRELIKRRTRLVATHAPRAQPADERADPAPLPPRAPMRGGGLPMPTEAHASAGRRLVYAFAAVVAIAIAGSALFTVVRRPTDSASQDDPHTNPLSRSPANEATTGPRAPTSTVSSLSASPRADGDKPDAATPATALPSPATTGATRTKNVARIADPPRKVAGAASAASDECVRLTGLLARGALEPGDLPKLKEACNR